MLECFAIKDEKVGAFFTPFWTKSVVDAVRSITIAVNQPDNNLNKFPEDFSLYSMCKMDEVSGLVTSLPTPERVCQLTELMKGKKI